MSHCCHRGSASRPDPELWCDCWRRNGEGCLQDFRNGEKPALPEEAPSNLAIIGRYILTPDIFDVCVDGSGKAGEIQITDAIAMQARNLMVLGYKFKGDRFDCGSVDGFVEATNAVYQSLYTG